MSDCYKVNDFDQDTYENKIYGDYKIKSKKPAISPLNDSKNQFLTTQTMDISNNKEMGNNISNQTVNNFLQQSLTSKKNDIVQSLTPNSINYVNPNHNILTDIKKVLKNEFPVDDMISLNNITGMKRIALNNDMMINAGGNLKKIKQNHYFSKNNLIFDPYSTEPEELFGLNNSIYLNNNEFIKTYMKNKENDLSFLYTLSLQKPYKFSSHFYLANLGQFYFTKQQNYSNKMNSNNDIPVKIKMDETDSLETLQFGNGFCTHRMYKSFINQGLLVYYYQQKVYIKEIDLTFYVILSEDGIMDFHNNDLFLFHTSLNDLMTCLLQKIQEKQKDENDFRSFRFLQNKKSLFPTILPEIIYEKILKKYKSNNNNNFNIDTSLQETFNKFLNHGIITNTICDSLEPLINQFYESQLSKYDLPKMHLGDFFFGYNHPKIQALVKLVKKNRNFSLNRLPEELREIFCNVSPYLKLKQKLTFTDLQDLKIPLPYKCLRL